MASLTVNNVGLNVSPATKITNSSNFPSIVAIQSNFGGGHTIRMERQPFFCIGREVVGAPGNVERFDSYAVYDFNDRLIDPFNLYGDGVFTVPLDGIYALNLCMSAGYNSPLLPESFAFFAIDVNGVNVTIPNNSQTLVYVRAVSVYAHASRVYMLRLFQNDIVRVLCYTYRSDIGPLTNYEYSINSKTSMFTLWYVAPYI